MLKPAGNPYSYVHQAYKANLGYHTKAASQNEADFPIAYNILTHKDVHQIEFLLRAIYRPQNVYCIHIDAKQPISFQSGLRAIAACFENVYIASKLESVVYAGFTRLQADINCMQDQVFVVKYLLLMYFQEL